MDRQLPRELERVAPPYAIEGRVYADAIALAGSEMQRDVAAVVHIGTCDVRIAAEEFDELIGYGPRNRSHRCDEFGAVRRTCAHHSVRDRTGHTTRVLNRRAQQWKLGHELLQDELESRASALCCRL